MPVIYSAPWVLPIITSPIENGAVVIDGNVIAAVGPRADLQTQFPGSEVRDFPESAIIPGLINTHSHLELTVMRGFLETVESNFFAWLRKLTLARMAMTADDLIASAKCGAVEAARAGITCLGDSSSAAVPTMMAFQQVGLRGIVYQESFGPDPSLAEQNVAHLRELMTENAGRQTSLVRAGISPHAPYTVSGPQLELTARLAIDEGWPLMMHAAESAAEKLFITEGRGAFAVGLQKRGIEWRAPGISTIQYLKQKQILAARPLLAHCINVDDADLEAIYESGASIAHCPKSNAKLRHGQAPLAKFIARGIKTGLGSDSVASNNVCDIIDEARFATLLARLSSEDQPEITATDALFAATLGGAQALSLDEQIGALTIGRQADMAIIDLSRTHQTPATDPAATIVFSSSGRDVVLTMVAGKEIYRADQAATDGRDELKEQLLELRARIEKQYDAAGTWPS